jgi:MFS superfamily sulfate permease-like transporter
MMLYIDPAATTVFISSATAIAVALGASFIIIWRKMKRGVQKTLHIDENANKEVEEELVILDAEPQEAEAAAAEAVEEPVGK